MSSGHSFIEYVKKAVPFTIVGYTSEKHQRGALTQLADVAAGTLRYETPATTLEACGRITIAGATLTPDNLPDFMIQLGENAHRFLVGMYGKSSFAPRLFMLLSYIKVLASQMRDDKEVAQFNAARTSKIAMLTSDDAQETEKLAKQRAYLGDFSKVNDDDMPKYFSGSYYEYDSKEYDDPKKPPLTKGKPLELQTEYLWFFCKKNYKTSNQPISVAVQTIMSLSNIDFKEFHALEMQRKDLEIANLKAKLAALGPKSQTVAAPDSKLQQAVAALDVALSTKEVKALLPTARLEAVAAFGAATVIEAAAAAAAAPPASPAKLSALGTFGKAGKNSTAAPADGSPVAKSVAAADTEETPAADAEDADADDSATRSPSPSNKS